MVWVDEGTAPSVSGLREMQTNKINSRFSMSNIIKHNHDKDGIDRRGFLKCMAWAGTGVLWTMTGGILRSQTLSQVSNAAGAAAGRAWRVRAASIRNRTCLLPQSP